MNKLSVTSQARLEQLDPKLQAILVEALPYIDFTVAVKYII